MEINATHPLVERLEGEQDGDKFGDLTKVLFDQAQLAEGGQLDDPAAFVRRLNSLMLKLTAG
jgi:molecular chaperone HtpG